MIDLAKVVDWSIEDHERIAHIRDNMEEVGWPFLGMPWPSNLPSSSQKVRSQVPS
jgi:hypothetical protein